MYNSISYIAGYEAARNKNNVNNSYPYDSYDFKLGYNKYLEEINPGRFIDLNQPKTLNYLKQ